MKGMQVLYHTIILFSMPFHGIQRSPVKVVKTRRCFCAESIRVTFERMGGTNDIPLLSLDLDISISYEYGFEPVSKLSFGPNLFVEIIEIERKEPLFELVKAKP